MRDDQFAEGVKRSLYAVTGNLEQDETQYFSLKSDVAQIETSVLPRYRRHRASRVGYSILFTTPEGKKEQWTLQGDLNALDPTITLLRVSAKARPTHGEILQEQYL